jgi:hypothetical protein
MPRCAIPHALRNWVNERPPKDCRFRFSQWMSIPINPLRTASRQIHRQEEHIGIYGIEVRARVLKRSSRGRDETVWRTRRHCGTRHHRDADGARSRPSASIAVSSSKEYGALFRASLEQPPPPSLIAAAIRKIIESGTWKLRHPCGPDAEPFLSWRAAMTDEQWIDFNALDADGSANA